VAFFVDTNVIVYAATDGPYRSVAVAILTAIAEGRASGRTSTSVIEEVWHIELSGRVGSVSGLAERAYRLFTPLLPVTDETVRAAMMLDVKRIGANDRIHAATCFEHRLGAIVTADGSFDHVPRLRRVDPMDTRRVSALLRQ
jgi:predicted nucleic acid-binding protein